MPEPRFAAALLLFAGILASPTAKAAEAARPPQTFGWGLTVAGLPIARADLTLDDRAGRYALAVDWHTTGIVGVFAAASGTIGADGRLVAGRPHPRDYRLSEVGGNGPIEVEMSFSGNRVGRVSVEPPPHGGDDVVPVLPEHRRGVADPLSAGLIPGSTSPESVCARTIPIFDGWSRWDLRLSPKEIRDEAPKGFRGPTAVCAVRWVPIAGHRTGHRSVRYMAENRNVEVRLARLADHDFWLPIEVTVGTLIGPARASLETVSTAER